MSERVELALLLALNCAASITAIVVAIAAVNNGYYIAAGFAFVLHWTMQFRLYTGRWMTEYWKEDI